MQPSISQVKKAIIASYSGQLLPNNLELHIHSLKANKFEGTRIIENELSDRKTYHSLHIEDAGALVDVLLGSDGACWELDSKAALEFLDVVLDVPVKVGHLHQLVSVDFAKPLKVDRAALLVHSMVALRVVLQDLIDLVEFKVLNTNLFINVRTCN